MAAVWFRKPVACSTCSDCTGCILKDYRTYRLDAVCTNGKHAGSNLYCTGSEIHCTGKQCNEWTAVFLVDGLQLIVAVLLMVLGVMVAASCFTKLLKTKKQEEA